MGTKLYEIYSGEELKIAEKIQQRRLQMLVHSYIYYELDTNIVSDNQWSKWATELQELQQKYPDIEKTVPHRKGFENWDASTGAFLPYKQPQIVSIANHLLGKKEEVKKPEVKQKSIKRKLF